MKTIYLIAIITLLLPGVSFAEHKSVVAEQMIDSDDPGIKGEDDGCDDLHYHGVLNEIADPAPNGCGHGLVVPIAHGRGDGETIPYTPAPEEPGAWSRFWGWVGSFFTDKQKEVAKDVVDVAAEANGVAPPGTVSELVDITKEATPEIIENAEHIEEYRENTDSEEDTLGLYRDPAEGLEEDSISSKFFKWLSSWVE
ncbi:MAG: hypothetical protein Q8P07_04365 [bacterium]|nr:hypothetical protein [bacterium]